MYKTDERIIRILKVMVKNGMTYREIGKVFDTSKGTIGCACYRNNIKSPLQDTTEQKLRVTLAREYANIGLSYNDIAHKLKISDAAAYRLCARHNIRTQPYAVDDKTIKMILVMLKQNKTSVEISKTLPGVTSRMALYYKKKFKIDGLKRGGVMSISQEELNDTSTLAAKGLSYVDIAKELSKKYDKRFGREIVRGRMKCYDIPYTHVGPETPWSDKEKALLKRMQEDIGWSHKTKLYFLQAFPNRTSEAIRGRLKKI